MEATPDQPTPENDPNNVDSEQNQDSIEQESKPAEDPASESQGDPEQKPE